jgi:hypothetical protein
VDAQHNTDEWPGIFTSTTGLVFFGTPFRGAEGMSQMEMLEAARREYQEDDVQPEVLKILEPGNEFLQDLMDQFGKTQRQVNKAQVACFGEVRLDGRFAKRLSLSARLTIFTEVFGERELWLPRSI